MKLRKILSYLTSIALLANMSSAFIGDSMAEFSLTADNSGTGINLSWDEVTDATEYIVYRRFSGALTGEASLSSPDSDIAIAGDTGVLASAYEFTAVGEDYVIEKLTVINDLAGAFGNPDTDGQPAIERVYLEYPDINGVQQTVGGAMSEGRVIFSNLDFFIENGTTASVNIKVDVSNTSIEDLSGMEYRLGIQDTGNDGTTFSAVGQASANVEIDPTITNATNINSFTVRKSKPVFSVSPQSSNLLVNGTRELFKTNITAVGDSTEFGRLIFDVTPYGFVSPGDDISAWNLFKNGSLVSSAEIWCTDESGGNPNDIQSSAGLEDCDGINSDGIATGTYKVIVSFNSPQAIAKDETILYSLRANIIGANFDDTLIISIADGDEIVPLTGLDSTSNTNNNDFDNDGKIYVYEDTTSGIFTSVLTDFSQLLGTERNIIWSDKSATIHNYPTVTDGDVTSGTGTADFTNGYLLNSYDLTAHVFYAEGSAPPAPSMTVALNTSTETGVESHTVVKGGAPASVFAFDLIGDTYQSIPVNQITLRLYADSEGGVDFSPMGDTAANTTVSSVSLYDGTDADIGGGASSLSLVDNDSTSVGDFDADSTDYYEVVFNPTGFVIPAGETITLTAKASLLGTPTATQYLAIDINPTEDIVAEDAFANELIPLPNASLNATSGAHDPEITILTIGTLTATVENNPDSDILLTGSKENLIAKYTFNAEYEDFEITDLTIVNDLVGDFGDSTVDTTAVDSSGITIKYPNVNDVEQSVSGTIAGGVVTFSGLDFYADASEDSYLEIYADISSSGLEALSGEEFRLGLQNYDNSASTFEAVGQSSTNVLNFNDADPTANILNSSDVNSFVARTAKPIFTKNVGLTTILVNGERELYDFDVYADGSIGLARIVFDVSTYGLSNITNFEFYKGSTKITAVNIYCPNAGAMTDINLADTGDLDDCDGLNDGSTENDTYKVIVSFNTEEAIAGEATSNYKLKATVVGVGVGDALTTSIAVGDDSTQLIGLSDATNPNTGKIYVDGVIAAGIFTGSSTDFRQVLGEGRNIIWTDKSADSYNYPTVTDGDVTSDSGSADFTNGYLLNISELGSHILMEAYNMNGASRAYAKASIWDFLFPKAYADIPFVKIASSITETEYSDVDVVSGTSYEYYVEAHNVGGLLSTSETITVEALTGPFAVTSSNPADETEGVNSEISQIVVTFNGSVDPDAIESDSFIYLCIGNSWDVGGSNESNFCSGAGEFINISTALDAINDSKVIITPIDQISDDTWYTVIIQDVARDNLGDSYVLQDGENAMERFKFQTMSDATYDSAIDGQAELSAGETTVTLSDDTVIDLSGGVSTESVGSITVGGNSIPLNAFTSGDLSNEDISTPRVVGTGIVQIKQAVKLESGTDGVDITVSNVNYPGSELVIPDGTVIMGDVNWNGTIIPPREVPKSGVVASGFSVGDTVVELGSTNSILLFDKPVSVVIDGVHTYVGYLPSGASVWTRIVRICDGSFSSPVAPVFPGECFISNGVDKTKIYTYHLTTFGTFTYTPTATPTTPTVTVSGGGGGGGGGYRTIQNAQAVTEKTSTADESAEATMHEVAPAQMAKFLDIRNHWAEAYIQEIAERGIVDGKTQVRYAPNDNISRAELIKIAMNSFGHEVSESVTEKPSKDVAIGDWSAPYIKAARDSKVIYGMEDSFGPNAPATRAFAATILVKAGGFDDVIQNYQNNYAERASWSYVGFPDVGMNQWYSAYIAYLKDAGIVEGYTDGNFGINKEITRAEIAKIAVKLIEKWEANNEEISEPEMTEDTGGETPSDETGDDEMIEEE